MKHRLSNFTNVVKLKWHKFISRSQLQVFITSGIEVKRNMISNSSQNLYYGIINYNIEYVKVSILYRTHKFLYQINKYNTNAIRNESQTDSISCVTKVVHGRSSLDHVKTLHAWAEQPRSLFFPFCAVSVSNHNWHPMYFEKLSKFICTKFHFPTRGAADRRVKILIFDLTYIIFYSWTNYNSILYMYLFLRMIPKTNCRVTIRCQNTQLC